MLSGANTGPGFLGVESYQPITYQGEAIEIGSVPGENFYMDGDQNFSFEGLMPDKIMDLQAEFINAGLLGPAVGIAFRPGVWDREVEGKIMKRLMGDANASGLGKAETGWENKLQIYLDNPVGVGDHSTLTETVNEQVNAIANARDKLKVLLDYYFIPKM